MIIAIDYDGTFDALPDMFTQLIEDYNHLADFMIVTCRNPADPIPDAITASLSGPTIPDPIPIIYTDGQAKRHYLSKLGYDTSDIIWIDNEPEFIIVTKREPGA